MVTYLHIMAKVYTIHQEVLVADTCGISFMCSTAHNYIFANVVLVADDQQTLLARIMEILRDGTEYGAMMHFVPLPQACTVEDTRTGHDNTIISNLYIAFDICKRLNCYILAELCGRIYKC